MERQQLNWTQYQTDLPKEQAAVTILNSLFIFINNVLVLLTFSRMRALQLQHYLMVGLCVADLTNLVPEATSTVIMLRGSIWLTKGLCDTLGMAFSVSLSTTSYIHSVMMIDKCLSIVSPLWHRNIVTLDKYKRTVPVLSLLSCFLLPVASGLILLHTGLIEFRFHSFFPNCMLEAQNVDMTGFSIAVSQFVFLPVAIQITTTALILSRIKKMRVTNRKRTFKAMKTLGLTVGLYMVCLVPMAAVAAWLVLSPFPGPPQTLSFAAVQFHMANSGMNYAIYLFSLPNFKLPDWRSSRVIRVTPLNTSQQT